MIARIVVLWIVGMVLIVPYSIYQLLFHAQREDYAFLIVAPLFWIFGFWGVVGPCLAAFRIRKLMKALESAQDSAQLREAFHANEGEEAVIDLLSSESGLPRWVARRIYHNALVRIQANREIRP